MSTIPPRDFNFKNEELPVVSGFTALNLERDLPDFVAYSPVFTTDYLNAYKLKVAAVQELVQPYSETVEGKLIGEHIDATLEELVVSVNHLEGYVNLAAKTIPMKPADFGLIQLRVKIRSSDLEGVLNLIRPVENNMERYKTELSAKGMTEALPNKFKLIGVSLANDKNKRYTMVSNRAALVQNNIHQLNDLYAQMTEICGIGKILYKKNDMAKLNDYTIAYLLKQVRRVSKPNGDKPSEEA